MMNDTLYIIGNGFDLHHGLKTSYGDFKESVNNRTPCLWELLLRVYGDKPKNDHWWWQFEEMLGKIDYANALNSYKGPLQGQFDVQKLLKSWLPSYFDEWIRTINDQMESLMQKKEEYIDNSAYFFTFNYTELLEKLYNVSKENIWHIHHSVREGNGIIVGHDSDEAALFKDYLDYKKERSVDRQDIADYIRQEAAQCAKGVKNRIYRHEDDFRRLYANIKHFVSMGFSFNSIDMPYIEKIIEINMNKADTDWTIYWYFEGEIDNMKDKLKRIGMREEQMALKKWCEDTHI